MPRRLPKWSAVAAGLVVAALHLLLRPDILATVGTLYDDVVYLSLGKAIAEGEGYRSIHLVGAPVQAKFPPVLPLSYAGLWRLTDSFVGTVYGAYTLSMLMLAAGTFALWRVGQRLGALWWLLAFLALGPLLLLRTLRYFAGAVSEPWLLLGWAASLVWVSRLGEEDEAGSHRNTALLLGLTLSATVLVRTQAVVLVPACLLALLIRRVAFKWIGVATVVTAVPLAIWRIRHGRMMARGPVSDSLDQSPYLEWMIGDSPAATLETLVRTAAVNIPAYFEHLQLIVVGWTSWKAALVVVACGLLALLGSVLSARRHPELLLTILAVVGVLAVWPFNQARFLTTLLPMCGLTAAVGASFLYERVPGNLRVGSALALAVLTLMLVRVNLARRASTYAFQASEGSLPVGMAHASQWILDNTDPDDHIFADYSGTYFLRTGRLTSIGLPEQPFTIPSVLAPGGRYLARRILADSVDYVVDARPAEQRIGPQVDALKQRCPEAIRPVPPIPTGDDPSPRYYQVTRDEDCLVPLSLEPGPSDRPARPR